MLLPATSKFNDIAAKWMTLISPGRIEEYQANRLLMGRGRSFISKHQTSR